MRDELPLILRIIAITAKKAENEPMGRNVIELIGFNDDQLLITSGIGAPLHIGR